MTVDKREVLDRLLTAWEARPHLRLGELLDLAYAVNPTLSTMLYRAENEALVEMVEEYAGVRRSEAGP